MIDHVLGRPSTKSRRLQVLAVLAFWSAYLFRGHKHGPPFARLLSRLLTPRLTGWQTVVMTMIYLYAARNFSTLVGLASPDPLANMYDATYFRATWVLTALDAGFWTAMPIRARPLRDLASICFSLYYMVAAEQADDKVRKVRSNLTVQHLRVSWNKGNDSPYLRFFQGLMRPRFTRWPPRAVRIPRPAASDYREPVSAWLYYDGPLADLNRHARVILDIPGGGFVAMDPRCNDDRLFAWAARTGLPILSLDYKKAPEYPYPHALNECYDVYTTLVRSRGRCIGLSGRDVPRIVIAGDSAGGSLATAMTLMVIESGSTPARRFQHGAHDDALPLPDGLILFYPGLDMNIGNWMSDEQMDLIRDRRTRGTNRPIVQRKSDQYNVLVGTPHQSDDEDDSASPPEEGSSGGGASAEEDAHHRQTVASLSNVRSPAPEFAHPGPSSWSRTLLQGGPHPQSPSAISAGTGAPSSPVTSRLSSAKQNHQHNHHHHQQQQQQDDSKPHLQRHSNVMSASNHYREPLRTRLATSSMISYFNDRVLTPEMMRAMIILYIGPHNRPEFSSDYLLSPVLAPDVLLARFPKTYFLTGERDPLVDDTVIFAGRLRRVKAAQAASGGARLEYRDSDARFPGFDQRDVAEVHLIPGISHGFLQFPTVYPPAWRLIDRSARWIDDIFADAERRRRERDRDQRRKTSGGARAAASAGAASLSSVVAPSKAGGGGNGPGASAAGAGAGGTGAAATQSLAGSGNHGGSNGGARHSSRRESSGEEDNPLEMSLSRTRGKPVSRNHPGAAGKPSGSGGDMIEEAGGNERGDEAGPGEEDTSSGNSNSPGRSGRTRRGAKRMSTADDKSITRLKSSEDLLGRRMIGLAGGLTGVSTTKK